MQALKSNSFPTSPDDAYNEVMKRIKKEGKQSSLIAFRTLSWIFHAKRPLQYDELREAVTFDADKINQLGNAEAVYPSAEEIVSCCKGSIVYDKTRNAFRFVHATMRTFISDSIKSRVKPNIECNLLSVIEVARICIAFVNLNEFDELERRSRRYKFCVYATQNWALHTKGEMEKAPDVQQAIVQLFGSQKKKESFLNMELAISNQHTVGDDTRTRGETFLHIVCRDGLATICGHVLDAVNGNNRYAHCEDLTLT